MKYGFIAGLAGILLVGFSLLQDAATETEPTPNPDSWVMTLDDNWEIDGSLPENAMLISLQGVANKTGPTLYFRYPEDWPFQFSSAVLDYYKDTRKITFAELSSPEDALTTLASKAAGYIVWDTNVRTSLIVAFTFAGLENAVVVSEAQIPMAEAAGLKQLEDFRGKFTGQDDFTIYSWAYDQYWDRCSRDFIIWMGGVHGNAMQPGVADFGILKNAFFTDLSADPADTLEYKLHNEIIAQLNEEALVMGWHSYAKDTEGQHVSLTSSYGLRVEGLNSLPNASYNHLIPTTPGYRFTNNHNTTPGETIVPEEKVYIAAIQTDCLGIGAWLKPGRGQIPYAWEVTMNWSWLFPGLMQFFYDMATPNDYFVGALSGPGYMYPAPIPPAKHEMLIRDAESLMKTLDLRVFEIMDYANGNRYTGHIDLSKDIIDRYYRGMPDAIGFINGYGPANTNANDGERVLLSYDYYLSPTRDADEAAADLEEVAALNPVRPYFLTMHVRESSDIERVIDILGKLGPEFEIVALDRFLKMASNKPTFVNRYLDRNADEYRMVGDD